MLCTVPMRTLTEMEVGAMSDDMEGDGGQTPHGTYRMKVVQQKSWSVVVDAESEEEAREKAVKAVKEGDIVQTWPENWSTNQLVQPDTDHEDNNE